MARIFQGMNLFMASQEEMFEDAVVIVEEGRIAACGTSELLPHEAEEVINLEGMTLLPGLIDAHIHSLLDASADAINRLVTETKTQTVLKAAINLEKTLQQGFTTIRDLGGKNYIEMELKEAINNELIKGPRMLVAGKLLSMTGGHGHQIAREADGRNELRKAAREQLKAGADQIKIIATGGVLTKGVKPGSAQLSRDEMEAAVEEAHRAGKKAASHAQGTKGIEDSLLAGIDSIEHGIFLDEKTLELMLESNAFLVPTLTAPKRIIEAGEEKGVPEYAVRKAAQTIDRHRESFQLALKAGAKIAMGTDAGTPFNMHGKNTEELVLMVEAGMKPSEAIRAATIQAAELLGIDDELGSIEVGKTADMIAVSGNPLENIKDMAEVKEVYQAGKRVF